MKKEYSGYLGEFEYDDKLWHVCDKNISPVSGKEILSYIGRETDCSDIEVPYGLVHATALFYGSNIVIPPVLPDTVVDADYVCYHCNRMVSPIILNEGIVSADSGMAGCSLLKTPSSIPSTLINGRNLYNSCYSLTYAVSVPPSVKNCEGMWRGCRSLMQFSLSFKEQGMVDNEGDWNIQHRGSDFRGYMKLCENVYGPALSTWSGSKCYVAISALDKYEASGHNIIYGNVIDMLKSTSGVPDEQWSRELAIADGCYERRKQLQAAKQSKELAGKKATEALSLSGDNTGQGHFVSSAGLCAGVSGEKDDNDSGGFGFGDVSDDYSI